MGNYLHLKTPEQMCDELKEAIKTNTRYYTQRLAYLEQKVDELSDPLVKDNEIAKITKERDEARANLSRGFGITEEEKEKIDFWYKNHIKTKHGGQAYNGTIGGGIAYHFYPTSIGDIGEVECTRCNEKFIFEDI